MTVAQEGKGKKTFATLKGVRISDVVSRVTYDMDNFNLISMEDWNTGEKKKSKPLPPGVSNIHTVFTYQSHVKTDDAKRLPPKLAGKTVKLLIEADFAFCESWCFHYQRLWSDQTDFRVAGVVSCLHRVAKF
eukprot:4826742-Amphidinium_carterae.1